MILHVIVNDKFIKPYVDFINEKFSNGKHYFFVFENGVYELPENRQNVTIIRKPRSFLGKIFYKFCYVRLLFLLVLSEKIIYHGLMDRFLIKLLAIFPLNLKRSYWCIWGGDLYYYECCLHDSNLCRYENQRRKVINKIGGLITPIKGEVDLVRKWYASKGKWYECFGYLSNLVLANESTGISTNGTIKVLVGNSADPSNNHLELFEKLSKLETKGLEIICPLSYGDQEYAQVVAEKGRRQFENFTPIFELLPYEEYQNVLSTISIAMFGHKRQQAIGNIVSLLSFGKTVYLNKKISSWSFFENMGVTCYDVDSFSSLGLLSDREVEKNKKFVSQYFSLKNLVKQWDIIFKS